MYDWKNVTLTCSGSEINGFIIIIIIIRCSQTRADWFKSGQGQMADFFLRPPNLTASNFMPFDQQTPYL